MELREMNLGDFPASLNPLDYKRMMETKHAEAQLRLASEKAKPFPDVLKVDGHEREIKMWAAALEKFNAGFVEYADAENKLKQELATFFELLRLHKRLEKKDVAAQIHFKDNVWKAIFFALVKKDARVKVARKFVLFGQECYELA